jgi:ferredoxin
VKVKVDSSLCRDHGQCVIAAPEVFRFDENQKLVWVEAPDASLRRSVEEAVDVCPEQAITIVDD